MNRLIEIVGCLLGLTLVLKPAAAAEEGNSQRKYNSALSLLKTLPYLQGYKTAPKKVGVTRYDRESAWPGVNLYVSGNVPGAFLIDIRGRLLHEWRINPEKAGLPQNSHCRRAYLFDNGDLLAIFEENGKQDGPLVKLDKNSRILWIYPGRCHHDLFVEKDGTIYVLTHRRRVKQPNIKPGQPILEDFVTLLNRNGKEIKSVSLIDCFINSNYDSVLFYTAPRGDIFHTNTIEVLNGEVAGRVPMFKKGHILTSFRHLSTIATVDLEEEKVTWMLWGMWRVQHDPTVLKNGNLLLFDNGDIAERSRILEFNPLTQEVVWSYQSDNFFSERMGTNQRLPNGNTLITESEKGKAFEVTPKNVIVWEFVNPRKAGDEDKLVATLYDLIRIDPGRLSFLKKVSSD